MRKTLIVAILVLLGYAPVCAQTSDSATLTIAAAGSTPLILNGSDLASVKRV